MAACERVFGLWTPLCQDVFAVRTSSPLRKIHLDSGESTARARARKRPNGGLGCQTQSGEGVPCSKGKALCVTQVLRGRYGQRHGRKVVDGRGACAAPSWVPLPPPCNTARDCPSLPVKVTRGCPPSLPKDDKGLTPAHPPRLSKLVFTPFASSSASCGAQ